MPTKAVLGMDQSPSRRSNPGSHSVGTVWRLASLEGRTFRRAMPDPRPRQMRTWADGDPKGPADIDLLRQVQLGDESGLEGLYARYGGLIFTLALRIVGDPELAREVLQDTFLRCWDRADTYDAERGRERSHSVRDRGVLHDGPDRRQCASRVADVPASGDRAGLLRRTYADGDRVRATRAPGNSQEQDARGTRATTYRALAGHRATSGGSKRP